MKLTKINLKEGGHMTVTVELSANELYRMADITKDMATERARSFEQVESRVDLARAVKKLEDDSMRLYKDAQAAVDQGTIKAAVGDFMNTEA